MSIRRMIHPMGKQLDLLERPPRKKPKRLMRVEDAGMDNLVNFVCPHCRYDDGWSFVSNLTEGKRGKPCPKCNPV